MKREIFIPFLIAPFEHSLLLRFLQYKLKFGRSPIIYPYFYFFVKVTIYLFLKLTLLGKSAILNRDLDIRRSTAKG